MSKRGKNKKSKGEEEVMAIINTLKDKPNDKVNTEAELINQIATLRTSNQILEKKIFDLTENQLDKGSEDELEKLKKELDISSKKVIDLTMELSDIKSKLEELNQANVLLTSNNEFITRENKELSIQNKFLESDIRDMRNASKNLIEQSKELEKDKDSFELESIQLRGKLSSQDREITHLKSENDRNLKLYNVKLTQEQSKNRKNLILFIAVVVILLTYSIYM